MLATWHHFGRCANARGSGYRKDANMALVLDPCVNWVKVVLPVYLHAVIGAIERRVNTGKAANHDAGSSLVSCQECS